MDVLRFRVESFLLKDYKPRPSSYPLLGPKYLLLGTLYPQLKVQGGSWNSRVYTIFGAVPSLGTRGCHLCKCQKFVEVGNALKTLFNPKLRVCPETL